MIVFRRLLRTSESNTELYSFLYTVLESGLQWTIKGSSQDYKE